MAMLLTAAVLGEGRSAPAVDWPLYRYDASLTGVAPGQGRIVKPEIKWEHYLGVPFTPIASVGNPATPNVADLDGDEEQERFALSGKTLTVTDLKGNHLCSLTVEGRPLGSITRVCKLFPERKGLQIVTFSNRMDTGESQGYCFSFDKGARNGEIAWTTGPLSGYHAPTLIVDDVDGDKLPEIVTAPHYRVQIFNGQTGELKAEIPWEVGRNYGVLLSRPRIGSAYKDLFIVCDFVLHVDCLRYQDGKWTHAWGHKYFEPNSPVPRGREQYIRVGPSPVADLQGKGRDEMVYMLVDAGLDDQWHLRVRDCESGEVTADVPGVWLWSVTDLDGDGRSELIYTPTTEKRPPTFCDLHFGQLADGHLTDLAVAPRVRPLLMNALLPKTVDTIADEGLNDLLRADCDGDGLPEVFYAEKSRKGKCEDSLCAASLTRDRKLLKKWKFSRPGHRLNLIHAGLDQGSFAVRIRDLADSRVRSEGEVLTVSSHGKVLHKDQLGKPGGFTTTPIVVDLNGDGRGEIVVQNAAGEIVALTPGQKKDDPPRILWSVPGVAMNPSPGYTWNGALCPQAADVDGDGKPEVLFASEDGKGRCSLSCVDGRGRPKWNHSFEGCAWGGLQAGVNLWTFGRFTGRKSGLDVYVDVHRRSKGSGEGWVLQGDTGAVVWHREGLVAKETAMPFGCGLPAVADLNKDGIDEVVQEFFTVYGAISGNTGEPLFPPAYLCGPDYFGKWVAYSSPTVADLNHDGQLEVYLNSASYARGAYAAANADGKPLWAEFHDNDEGSNGFGPVGDFDGDGNLEIGVPVLNGTLLCLSAADGSHKWKIDAPIYNDVVAADVNGDGTMELVFCDPYGKVRAVSGKDGHEVWSISTPAPGRPVVADVDGDGLVEVLVVGYDGVLRVIG